MTKLSKMKTVLSVTYIVQNDKQKQAIQSLIYEYNSQPGAVYAEAAGDQDVNFVEWNRKVTKSVFRFAR